MKPKPRPNSLSLNLRLYVAGKPDVMLGPGKIELLGLIHETGSISEAARRMKMSYMKAWLLIQTMKPLVQSSRGGRTRGGAQLTPRGTKAVALYRKMEQAGLRAAAGPWKQLQRLLSE
jgi:molybdate transport system regulatory protein